MFFFFPHIRLFCAFLISFFDSLLLSLTQHGPSNNKKFSTPKGKIVHFQIISFALNIYFKPNQSERKSSIPIPQLSLTTAPIFSQTGNSASLKFRFNVVTSMAGLVNPPPRSPSLPSPLRSAEALTKPPEQRFDFVRLFLGGKTQKPTPPEEEAEEENEGVGGGCGVRNTSWNSINGSEVRVRVRGRALPSVESRGSVSRGRRWIWTICLFD